MEKVRVWEVMVDGRGPEIFDDLDVALAYLRGDIGTNGSEKATLSSQLMTRVAYNRLVDARDAAPAAAKC